jgi:hypothetical protein
VTCFGVHSHLLQKRVVEVPRKMFGFGHALLGTKKIDVEGQLMQATLFDDPTTYQELYASHKCADPDFPISDHLMQKRTALHLAALTNNKTMAKFLLLSGDEAVCGSGSAVDMRTVSGKTPLHYVVVGNHTEMVDLLLAAGATPSDVDNLLA